jgi:Protein of unknown function (DUF1353)
VIRVLPHWEMPEHSCAKFQLMEPFTFVSKEFGRISVPKGFETDFGSVPDAAKPVVDDDDPDLVFAAIVHDYLYRTHGEVSDSSILPSMCLTRYQADCVLYEAMIAAGAPVFKSWLVFRAVRVGGLAAWSRSHV